ncbi:uncharacterized protein LOC122626221 [Drosophila teissieri]|uniref:uncharacterized protein LOC122626221 n=1 Tax=Drosophila teissieri TaxID=7243 RepID=UPI001CB9F6B3|nr:uncharacterized protein LOC122626221 [Drosophila teissieri]
MQCSYILAICASLLLLKLELGHGNPQKSETDLIFRSQRSAATSVSAGPSQELIKAAREVDLDEVGLRELWNSRQPLVIRNQNDAGHVTTVTYELSPDGRGIARHRVVESTLPARLEDNSASKPREEWEYVPRPGHQLRPIGESSFGTGNFETNGFGTGFPRPALFPNWEWELPSGVTPKVTTRTETDNLGRKVTITTRSYSGTLLPGSNVFKQTFPDISEEPGPIHTDSNPNTASFTPSRTAPTESNSVHRSGTMYPSQGAPVFVPVIDSTPTTQRTSVPLPTLAGGAAGAGGSDQVIDDFLNQVDLSASEIENSNGEVVKTIVDKNGRILTARFVLSSVKGTQEGPQQQKPTK